MKIINGLALVEIIKKEKTTASGIIVTDNMLVNDEGIVLDMDPEVSHIVSVGDRVKFNPNNGHDFEYEGKKCKFLKVFDKDSPRTDIIGVYGKD
jgi:co-chaperonin GroES (HSP10)